MIGADHRHARELALRAGHGREAHALHAGDLLQHLLQLEHAGEEALRRAGRAGAGSGTRAASRSVLHALGLYFIVHEPSG